MTYLVFVIQAMPTGELEAVVPILTPDAQLSNSSVLNPAVLFHHVNVSEIAQLWAQSPNWSEIGFAFETAVIVTIQCLQLWIKFLLLLSVPIVQAFLVVTEAALPHVLTLVTILAEYVNNMDPLHQMLLAGMILLILICIRRGYVRKARMQYVRTRRQLELRYRAFVASLSAKWRVLAILLPHVLFFVVSFGALYWLPQSMTSVLNNEALCAMLSVGYPLVHSIGAIRQKRFCSKKQVQSTSLTSSLERQGKTMERRDTMRWRDNEWKKAYEACLKYWVIWSVVVCFIGMMTLFLPAFVTSFFSIPLSLCNVVLIWMHSPFTRGTIALYTLVSPLISPYANRIQERDVAVTAETAKTTNMLVRLLVSFRVVPEHHVHLAKDLWSQGPALFGLIFMFTPGFLASRGSLLMGFGFPAYVTIGVLSEKCTRRYEWWLAYFIVAVTADYLITALGREIGWLPLFYHLKLLVMMWLQFPYFQGASRIFNACFSSVFIVPECKDD